MRSMLMLVLTVVHVQLSVQQELSLRANISNEKEEHCFPLRKAMLFFVCATPFDLFRLPLMLFWTCQEQRAGRIHSNTAKSLQIIRGFYYGQCTGTIKKGDKR